MMFSSKCLHHSKFTFNGRSLDQFDHGSRQLKKLQTCCNIGFSLLHVFRQYYSLHFLVIITKNQRLSVCNIDFCFVFSECYCCFLQHFFLRSDTIEITSAKLEQRGSVWWKSRSIIGVRFKLIYMINVVLGLKETIDRYKKSTYIRKCTTMQK